MAKKKSFLTELAVEAALLGLNIASKLGKLNSSFSHEKNSFKLLFVQQNICGNPKLTVSCFLGNLPCNTKLDVNQWLIKFKLITVIANF